MVANAASQIGVIILLVLTNCGISHSFGGTLSRVLAGERAANQQRNQYNCQKADIDGQFDANQSAPDMSA
jgi:hypothetical protein